MVQTSLRCDRWQGWGDSRVRIRDALYAAIAMKERGVLGIDKFMHACEAVGAYEYALVPPLAIDQLIIDNVDILVLDTKSRAFWRWAGLNLLSNYGEEAIRSKFLKEVYIANFKRLPRWNKYAPVILTLRAAVSGMLRGGKDPITSDSAAATVPEEIRCSVYGTMTSPSVRWAFKLLILAVGLAIVARAALLAAFMFFPIYAAIATGLMKVLLNIDIVSLPWKVASVFCIAFGTMVAFLHFQGQQFAKASTLARYAAPIYTAFWALS